MIAVYQQLCWHIAPTVDQERWQSEIWASTVVDMWRLWTHWPGTGSSNMALNSQLGLNSIEPEKKNVPIICQKFLRTPCTNVKWLYLDAVVIIWAELDRSPVVTDSKWSIDHNRECCVVTRTLGHGQQNWHSAWVLLWYSNVSITTFLLLNKVTSNSYSWVNFDLGA